MTADWVCALCAAPNRDGTRFCGQCGAPASIPAAPAVVAPSREERRQITVLFSDASGYTTMAEKLDPEVVRDVMGRVYRTAESISARYRGRVDKLMGDAVLIVFGDPVAHEDDAERAIRAALELHAAVDAMRPEIEALTGSSFQMHSGINSGVVVTGELAGDHASGPLGDMVNVAARLQSVAGRGEILIGPDASRQNLTSPTAMVWVVAGVAAGLVFGVAGGWASQRAGWRAVLGRAVLPAVFGAEAVHSLLRVTNEAPQERPEDLDRFAVLLALLSISTLVVLLRGAHRRVAGLVIGATVVGAMAGGAAASAAV